MSPLSTVTSLDRLNLALQVAAVGCALLVILHPFFGIGAALLTACSVLVSRHMANRKDKGFADEIAAKDRRITSVEQTAAEEIAARDRRITSIEYTASEEIQRVKLAASTLAMELEATRDRHRKSALAEDDFVGRLYYGPKGRVKIAFPWGMPSEYYAFNENDAGKTFNRLVKLIRRGGWLVDERIPPARNMEFRHTVLLCVLS